MGVQFATDSKKFNHKTRTQKIVNKNTMGSIILLKVYSCLRTQTSKCIESNRSHLTNKYYFHKTKNIRRPFTRILTFHPQQSNSYLGQNKYITVHISRTSTSKFFVSQIILLPIRSMKLGQPALEGINFNLRVAVAREREVRRCSGERFRIKHAVRGPIDSRLKYSLYRCLFAAFRINRAEG